MDFSLLYSYNNDATLYGYSNNDWRGDQDERKRKKSTGYVYYLRSTAFTWISKKQSIVALSIWEAEYVAVSSSVCEAIWLKNLLK